MDGAINFVTSVFQNNMAFFSKRNTIFASRVVVAALSSPAKVPPTGDGSDK